MKNHKHKIVIKPGKHAKKHQKLTRKNKKLFIKILKKHFSRERLSAGFFQ